MTVRKTAIPEYLDLAAHIEPDPTRVVHVFAPAGGRITEMRVRPWDRVEKGQTLAELESSDLARAVADYHKALADNQVKQKQLARSQDLLDHNAISEREFQQAQGDAQQAQAEVEAAREQIQVFGMDPDHASTQLLVKAPRSGVILDVGAAPGEFSQALSALRAALQPLRISPRCGPSATFTRKILQAAKSGEPAQVTLNAYPGRAVDGARERGFGSGGSDDAHAARARGAAESRTCESSRRCSERSGWCARPRKGLWCRRRRWFARETMRTFLWREGNGRFERRDVKLGRVG